MRLFNAFQTIAAFVGWPFFVSWLSGQTFKGHNVAFYSACALYVVAFGFMVALAYWYMEHEARGQKCEVWGRL